MIDSFSLLDVVTLIEDLPEQNLWRGHVGTIVDILADGQAFEVEVSGRDGQVYASDSHPTGVGTVRAPPLHMASTP